MQFPAPREVCIQRISTDIEIRVAYPEWGTVEIIGNGGGKCNYWMVIISKEAIVVIVVVKSLVYPTTNSYEPFRCMFSATTAYFCP